MDSFRLAIKLFAREGQDLAAFSHKAIVPLFHSWIQTHAVSDHLLIDVADYDHVPNGPGTVLVSHEANISTDRAEGRPGLLYVRKQPLDGAFTQRLRTVVGTTLALADRLERGTEGAVRFRTDELLFRIHDRLLAPNTPATLERVKPELQSFFEELLGPGVVLEHKPSELTLFEVTVKSSRAPELQTLMNRAGAGSAVAAS